MVLTQAEAPSSSPLLSPPSSWDGTGGGGSRGLLRAACRAIHHGECLYRPGARTQAGQVVPGRQWEEMGMNSPGTVFTRGPGLATEERSGACQVVDEMQGLMRQRKQNEGTTCRRHFNFSCVWKIWRLSRLSQIKKIGYWCFAGGREKSPDL